MNKKVKILLVGETWFVVKFHIKGFDTVPLGGYEDFSVWFMDAMKQFPDIEAEHMPNHVALTQFPQTLEEMNKYDVIIFSDVGKNTIQLYPDMFKVPMGPDRLSLIKDYVAGGKSFVMAGGWNCFEGIRGIPGYHDTVVETILPVNMLPYDDRVETPQGVQPSIIQKDHPIFKDLPAEWPVFMGYNKVKIKSEGNLLAKIGEDPFIAYAEYGKGRAMAFTSDLAKHWGTGFISWPGYAQFWANTVRWLAGK
jgi:uncharacterized membrane protein